jgi:hypothetical protein
VEVLPNATVGIFLKDKNQTFLYHPQTEALLQWFEMGKTSDAIAGAFSYRHHSAHSVRGPLSQIAQYNTHCLTKAPAFRCLFLLPEPSFETLPHN